MKGLFFTGTDTGVGKTYVVAAVLRHLRSRGRDVGVCKPVATGAAWVGNAYLAEDTRRLAEAAGLEAATGRITPFSFPEPAAPPVAAREQGVTLTLSELVGAVRYWEARHVAVLVEGVGGLLCPLTERETVADLASALDLPVIIVTRRSLGTLNHSLLTLEAAERRGLRVGGLVVNETEPPATLAERTNVEVLCARVSAPVLAVVPHRPWPAPVVPEVAAVDWWRLCGAEAASEFRPISDPIKTN
jgi:dethiobiotin synthetase